jgi:HSP20 family molecular chaperone IbpA
MRLFNLIAPRSSRDNETANGKAPEYTVKPAYRLNATADAWNLTVQLPGVTKEGLELSAEEGFITIRGRRSWQKPEGWTSLYRETADATFALTLEHDNQVNVDRIQADLKDGVLSVTLPKAEALKPRKIAVN